MATYIRIQEYCVHYQVPTDFVEDLVSAGLLKLENDTTNEINEEQFARLERFRQHQKLPIS